MSLKERAAATIAAGYKAFRIDGGQGMTGNVFDVHQRVREVAKACKEVREGVGEKGDWSIDFHQKFEFPDALRLCRLIEEYEPYLVEDPTRDEQFLADIPKLRKMTTCPLAAGEEWGQRWNFNTLVENHDIDYIRATLPNVGGITEMMKIAALCETHAIGIVPHFTGRYRPRRWPTAWRRIRARSCSSTTMASGPSNTCRSAWISSKASCTRTTVRDWA
jgi:L-alanine-DL-glutamate epimerase-like enolase superfamily enzyme